MIDQAAICMAQGHTIALERIEGKNDNMFQSHFHEFYELYYLESGERYHMVEDQLYQTCAGEFIIFPPYVMHHSYSEKNISFRRLVLYFKKEEITFLETQEALASNFGVYKTSPTIQRFIHSMLQELMDEQTHPQNFKKLHLQKEFMSASLNFLLLKIIREGTMYDTPCIESPSLISEILNYIHKHYALDISLDQLSAQFFISPSHLCREFKRSTNTTLIQYLNTIRILHAQRLFLESDKNITQISQETGFSNVTHFNRVFKSITGNTPSQMKKNLHAKVKSSK